MKFKYCPFRCKTCMGRVHTFHARNIFDVADISSSWKELPIMVPELVCSLPSASVTSYGPSHLGLSFLLSLVWLALLFRYTRSPGLKLVLRTLELSRLISKASSFCTMSISAVLMVGMLIFAGITTSVLYVSKNGVSLLLDLIMVRCAYKTCGISSIQSLLLSSSRAFIPSLKILFALSTKPLACGCLTEAKRWRMHIFSHQSLNGLSLNCFSLLDIISPGFLTPGGEPGNLDIPESSFLHPHVFLACSILYVWLLLPRILFQRAYCKIPH
ncbi:hypothetical protein Tco_0905428 [Tanacetum coccineum]